MTKFIAGLVLGSVGTIWILWQASKVGANAIWPVQEQPRG